MPTYTVTPDARRVPAARFVAEDLVDLGHQVARHFTRHKHLSRSIPFNAEIGAEFGAIHQAGLPRPLTFTITETTAAGATR